MPSHSSFTFSAVVESLLSTGVSVRFRAGGRSMQPAVRDGECVTVAPAGAGEVGLGDIVLCETWRGPLAHRVVAIVPNGPGGPRFVLRGDASLACDRPVGTLQMRGRVVSVERNGRPLSLAIAGGAFGRLAFVMGLRARAALVAATRRFPMPAAPIPTPR